MPFDFYPLLRPFLFSLDAEAAHNLAISCLGSKWTPRVKVPLDPVLASLVCGLKFSHPVGLAAGFDKQANAIKGVLNLGFGFVEIGTVIPKPQMGNSKPRVFRIPSHNAIINRFGFNSDGLPTVLARVQKFYDTYKTKSHAPVGINIGKNKDSIELADDYVDGVKAFAPLADYLTINVSSPNTPGLRDLQQRAPLEDLLKQVLAARDLSPQKPPLFVKIAPDQTAAQLEDIAEISLSTGVNGIIIGNTTLSRPEGLPPDLASEAGGLSGDPLRDMSTKILADMYRLTKGQIPLIGCGGIASGSDAYTKIRAGASLVQIYTALIYQGPLVVKRVASELTMLLKRDGFTNLSQAIGIDSTIIRAA